MGLGDIHMQIAVLKERRPGETRVAATPDTVKKLVGLGCQVVVENGRWRQCQYLGR